MAIEAIGAPAARDAELPPNAGIGQQDFLRILLSQLRFQDPLKPVDNQQLVAQLAQFSALEINRQQSAKIDTLLAVQAGDLAVSLIGRNVEVGTEDGGSINGSVESISFRTGEPLYTILLNGFRENDVPASRILRVLPDRVLPDDPSPGFPPLP